MREKSFLLRHLNARALKSAVFSVICRLPAARTYLNYYQNAASFEDAALEGSLRTLTIRPVRDYGLSFTERERREILQCEAADLDSLTLTYKMARVQDVTILGSSGVSVSDRGARVLYLDDSRARMHPNWVVARPLRFVPSDGTATYVNLLGVRKGHRHFAHFFWDMLVPLFVYLKNWHDAAERVVCLVREDLSPIQRDAFRFIEADWPGIAFQTLRANEKMRCRNSVFIAYQNRNHGKDNAMAADALRDIRDMFLRHYALRAERSRTGRRVYISRNDAAVRRVLNEAEIFGFLSTLGFEICQPGRMSFRDQVTLFHSAGHIVAPHGAALANLMFCRPGTLVLEIFPDNFRDEGFLKLARALGLIYDFILAGPGDFRQDFRLDLRVLEAQRLAPVSL